jgi:energy-coupling factor transporter ATP-binding protein EcfA2
MPSIKVKNFGPIQDGYLSNGGFLEIKKVTVFIGNQGSGKSTIAKLVSTFIWMEKALVRGDLTKKELVHHNRFRKRHCAYQNIHNFFSDETSIEYTGIAYRFTYHSGKFECNSLVDEHYPMPKIMYVPAERNFVSAVLQPEKLKYLPQNLYAFLEEFIRSNEEIEGSIELPVKSLSYRFEKNKRSFKLMGKQYEIMLSEASSGLQSLIPLYLVSKNLAEGINNNESYGKSKLSLETRQKLKERLLKILSDKNTTDDFQITAIELLSSITKNDCFINIVEEPEQNLFPSSQREILFSLLAFNNSTKDNNLIMTTHSPYLINDLTLVVKAHAVSKTINDETSLDKIGQIVPIESLVSADDLAIYELDEETGTIHLLPNYKGLPSDENYLNKRLEDSNEAFAQLQKIERGWQ